MSNLLRKMMLRWLSNTWLVSPIKIEFWKMFGIKIGSNTKIGFHVYFDNSRIKIGNDCLINVGTSIICGAGKNITPINIGNKVQIGPNCTILGLTHYIGDIEGRAGQTIYTGVSIEDGCWLGGSVTVLPNVTIRKGCVIAAGAVIITDTEPNGLYAGVPAVRKRDL